GSKRVDYTIIGSGVNFASRLKSSASPFRIMLSSKVKERLAPAIYDKSAMNPLFFSIKNKKEIYRAFEYNPHYGKEEIIQKIENIYWDFLNKNILEERTIVKDGMDINLVSELGNFKVLDFSINGFCAKGTSFVARNVAIMVQIRTSDLSVAEKLTNVLLDKIQVQVKWSRPSVPDQFVHGLKIMGLNELQKSYIAENLRSVKASFYQNTDVA
ncbi:MAG: hypothetical protein HQK54_05505, partial [Oligoflexales bacterium]|nr:hypothetical protein [Oligoflexales bacterium]